MQFRQFLSGLFAVAVIAGVSPAALADDYHRTLVLNEGAGEFTIEGVNPTDRVVLELVNPNNVPVTFRTTQNLGNQKEWLIPANSRQVVSFVYTQPFSDDVNFVVENPGGVAISQGTLWRRPSAANAERPVAYGQSGATTTTQSQQNAQPDTNQSDMQQNSVRGYW